MDIINDNGHHHIYLSKDIDASKVTNQFLNLLGSSKLCLLLNGHDLTHGGYILLSGAGVVMNIMGSGNVTFTATNTSDGYDAAGLYVSYGSLNLYGEFTVLRKMP